jgi:hypothetical protein
MTCEVVTERLGADKLWREKAYKPSERNDEQASAQDSDFRFHWHGEPDEGPLREFLVEPILARPLSIQNEVWIEGIR